MAREAKFVEFPKRMPKYLFNTRCFPERWFLMFGGKTFFPEFCREFFQQIETFSRVFGVVFDMSVASVENYTKKGEKMSKMSKKFKTN